MVICLERGADLHTAQLMPLPLTLSCCLKALKALKIVQNRTNIFSNQSLPPQFLFLQPRDLHVKVVVVGTRTGT